MRTTIFFALSIMTIILGKIMASPDISLFGNLLLVYTFSLFCRSLLLKLEEISDKISDLSNKIGTLADNSNSRSLTN